MKKYLLIISFVLAVVLTGCGSGGGSGSSSSSGITGVFIDDIVQGIKYVNGSNTGYTDENGQFPYNGGTVEFYIGKIKIGSMNSLPTDKNVFIQDIVGVNRDNITDVKVLKIAKFLQSLDTSGNSEKIILSQLDTDKFIENKDIDNLDIDNELTKIGKIPKTESEVKEHLGTTMRKYDISLYNYTPQIEDSSISTYQNTIKNSEFKATDKNDKFLTYMIQTNPNNGTVTILEDTNSFKYTPNNNFLGSDSFTYKAYDGEKFSEIGTVDIDVVSLPVSNGSDVSAPTSPTLVSLDSTSTNKVTLFWLNATDETTSLEEMRYEVHMSMDENFTVSTNTLNQTLVNTFETDILNLTADTTYFIKIKALDNSDNFSLSEEKSIKTLALQPALSPSVVLKKAVDLKLQDAQIQNDSLVFEDSKKAEVPEVNDIIVGNSEDKFLKKVVSISKVEDKTTIQTQDIAISEVLDTAKLNSKVLLFGDIDSNSASKSFKRSVRYSIDNKKETTTSWNSGRFSVSSKKQLTMKNKITRNINVGNSVFDIEIPTNDTIQIETLETLQIDIGAIMKVSSIDDGYKFISMKLISLEHPDKNHTNNFSAWYTTTEMRNGVVNGYLKWTPKKSYSDAKNYTATFEVTAEDKECSDILDLCDIEKDTIEVDILVVDDGTVEIGRTTTSFDSSSEFINDVTLDFTPLLVVEHEVEGGSLKHAKVELTGTLDFDVLTEFKYNVSKNSSYEQRVVEKSYKSVYLVAGLPVYQEISFTVDAYLDAGATGSIEASSNLDTSFEIKAGVEYDGTNWNDLTSHKFSKDYTAKIRAAGGVTVDVRLVPNIEIKFYEIASSGLSVEPWIKGDLSASATAIANTDFESFDTLGLYKVETLDLDIGLEAKVYADLTVWEFNLAHYPSDSDKKTIFNPSLKIFSMPNISLSKSSEDICTASTYTINATTTDGTNNPFDNNNISWVVFPSDGATVTQNSLKEVNFNFTKKDEYQVYFVGNSLSLGATFGKQYEYVTVDTRGCTIVEPDTIAPIFSSSNTISVNENQILAITLTATDENTITYSISGTDADNFNVNSSSGVFTFKTAPDYETKSSYTFVAAASDGVNTTTQNITITILDVDETIPDDSAPVWSIADGTRVSVNENQLSALTLLATDENTITYSLFSGDAHSFNVNSSTGVVTFKIVPDYETKSVYTFLAKASDNKGNVKSIQIYIDIENVDETPASITHEGYSYETVTSPYTGRIWLDRNLGASQVCTSLNDEACFGDYYQWGRNADGHEKKDSSTTSVRATSINNASVNFITNITSPQDWLENTIQDSNNIDDDGSLRVSSWSKSDGSSVCPNNFAVPTSAELFAETINVITPPPGNNVDHYNGFLKIPSSGNRNSITGDLSAVGNNSYLWSSSKNGNYSYALMTNSSSTMQLSGYIANGFPLRCIKAEIILGLNDITNANGKDNAISSPTNGDTWIYDITKTVSWNSTNLSGTTVRLYVLNDDPTDVLDGSSSDVSVIKSKTWYQFATDITNDGSYSVNPSDLNGNGNAYKILIVTNTGQWSISTGQFTLSDPSIVSHNGFTYGTVTSPITGRVWLDRNLGATQVCTKSRDDTTTPYANDAAYVADQSACFGDYYQWGRLTDGHEKTGSSTIATRATDITNAGVNFITNGSSPYDWVENTTQDSNDIDDDGSLRTAQWSKTDGSSICPIGFRVPTSTELYADTTRYAGVDDEGTGAVDVTNSDTAFKNFLKFPVPGNRNNNDGSLWNQGYYGVVWSSLASGVSSQNVHFNSSSAGEDSSDRAYGFSVRCVKD